MFSDSDFILISGLQHLVFCEKQWALIHVEGLWSENSLTVDGSHLHEKVHRIGRESRGNVKLATSLALCSYRLGLSGVSDMVEFHRDDENGVYIGAFGARCKWRPYPVEYKRGRKRPDAADEMQLCAQAVCLEEMLGAQILHGAIYYGEPKRRTEVDFTETLRAALEETCARARELMVGLASPSYNVGRHCRSCSMEQFCMPDYTGECDHSARYVSAVYRQLKEKPQKEAEI